MSLIVLQKYKPFLKDLIINTFSFFIYIFAQQLLFMPLMGKWLAETQYTNFVIYISLFSILSNALGNELGIVSQVLEDDINFNKLLHLISAFSFVITFIGLIWLHFNILDSFFLSLCVFLSNYRLYSGGYFRKNQTFYKVFVLNICYLIGILIGLGLFKLLSLDWVPMLIAEILSLMYCLKNSDIAKKSSKKLSKETLKIFSSFSFISFLNNLITYLDKVIIYPILGPVAVNVYYATTTMSKIVNMIINPLHGVLLTWIKKDSDKNKLIKKFIFASIPLMIFSIILSIPFTYFAMKVLYSQFLKESLSLIFPVSLALGASIGIALLKSLLLKFVESQSLIKIYSIYFVVFFVLAYLMSQKFLLIGFCYAVFISKCILLVEFIFALYSRKEN